MGTNIGNKEATMSAAETQVVETEIERVERWRAEALEKVGFDPISAVELAARPDVDLHHALALVESGCPPETALRILI
jgi:hypothetical protein